MVAVPVWRVVQVEFFIFFFYLLIISLNTILNMLGQDLARSRPFLEGNEKGPATRVHSWRGGAAQEAPQRRWEGRTLTTHNSGFFFYRVVVHVACCPVGFLIPCCQIEKKKKKVRKKVTGNSLTTFPQRGKCSLRSPDRKKKNGK